MRKPAGFVRALRLCSKTPTLHPFLPPLRATPQYSGRRQRCLPAQSRAFSVNHCKQAVSGGSAPSAANSPAPLTQEQYHKLSDAYIDTLLSDFEQLQEEDEEVDVEYSAGVLNLKIPDKGTYVINKQPPNKQIWLSSPVSGPKRYDYVLTASAGTYDPDSLRQLDVVAEPTDKAARESTKAVEGGQWVYLRDGTSLTDLLRSELGVELQDSDVTCGDDRDN